MKEETLGKDSMDYRDDRTDCFGEFDQNDRICRSLCALRLRCTIEKEQNLRMEILEELVSVEHTVTPTQ